MNEINFSQGSGNFELDKRTFEFMQQAYQSLNILGAIVGTENLSAGKGYILSGVYDTAASSGDISGSGSNYSDGYVYINGEVVKFQGGTSSSNIVLDESTPSLGTPHDDKYKEKIYRFGTGVGSIPFQDLKRVPRLMEAAFMDEVRIYGGSDLSSLPLGWYLCDGTNGTIDLRGRFPIQYNSGYTRGSDSSDFNLDVIGTTGGERDHTLIEGELPSHDHNIRLASGAHWDTNTRNPGGSGEGHRATLDHVLDIASTENAGSGQRHNNMPPYKVVYYIQYKGYVKP